MNLVLLCFFLSGFGALVYQTAWTREFAFVFGTSELAVATVLAGYMGGLAAGAAAGARLAPRVRRPVLAYGLLELGVAVSALLVPLALRALGPLYVAVFSGVATAEAGGLRSALFYLACSFVVLVLPTGFMGATLPLLARHAVRRDEELGPRIGLLYAVNTAGAVAGALLAAFLLLDRLGLRGTVWVAVATNVAVFLAAAALSRRAPAPVAAGTERGGLPLGRAWGVLPLMLVSGAVSFSYEIVWTRLLGHLVGGSVQAFATMLASFLLGIAIGSALASRAATTPSRSAAGLGLVQIGSALAALLAFACMDTLADAARLLSAEGRSRAGVDVAVAVAALLPATLCIGATFPFAVRVLARGGADAGPASARVYAWNTVGAIVGAVGTGFFVLPALGFAGTVRTAVALSLVLGVASVFLVSPVRARIAVAAAVLLAASLAVAPPTPWRLLRIAPVSLSLGQGRVAYYAVGRSATVLLLADRGEWHLRSSGLPEASISPPGHLIGRRMTARWLGILPTLARSEARSMLVIGFGGGVALETVPRTITSIDVVELEEQVLEANRSVSGRRWRDPFADPRIRVLANDARSALAVSRQRYDAIVSQPSHPWTGGASHLYTREFFELVRGRLTGEGVFLQWIGPAFVDEALFRSLLATLGDVFEHVRVYQPEAGGGILFLAGTAPLGEADDPPTLRLAAADLAWLGLARPEDVFASLLLDEAGTRAASAGAALNTDDRNGLRMRSARLRGTFPVESFALREGLLPEPPEALDEAAVLRRTAELGFEGRLRRAAEAPGDEALGALADGLLDAARGRALDAGRALARALRARPADPELRAAWLELRGAIGLAQLPEAPTSPEELAVARGLALEEARAWAELASLEPELAAVGAGTPFEDLALRLRAAWRVSPGGSGSADAARGREALELLQPLVARPPRAGDLELRLRAASLAGDPVATLSSAQLLARVSPPGAQTGSLRARVARVEGDEEVLAWRNQVLAELGRGPGPRGEALSDP